MEIGSQLREARRQRGLTLEDISFETKIPPKILEAIERDDLSQLPRGPFARGFVRAYADAVDVDASEFLKSPAVEASTEPIEDTAREADEEEVVEERRVGHGWLVVVLGTGLAYWIYAVPPRTAADSKAALVTPEQTTGSESNRAVSPESMAAAEEGLRLQVSSSGACAVTATVDGRPLLSRVVAAGETVRLPERGDVVVKVVDAGGCAYSLSGAPTRRADRSQEMVIRLTGNDTGALLARAQDSRAKSPEPEIRRVSATDTTGTTGTFDTGPELTAVPLDASIGDLLPSAQLPAPSISPDQEAPQDISKG